MSSQKTLFRRHNFIITLMLFFATQGTLCDVKVIFSHGIIDCFKQAFWYAKEYTIDEKTYHNERYLFTNFVTFNYPDAFGKLYENPLWFKETSFGQSNELERLTRVYTKVVKQNTEESQIILFGLSRGASVILNFVGTHITPEVKALVLESPYDCVGTIIDSVMSKCSLSYVSHSWGEYIAESIFKKYKRNGIHPCDVLCNISHTIPILIICSKEDSLVPWSSSYAIYQKLQESGHPNVHILITNHGKHAKILSGIDGEKYQAVAHAFFKHYNLPHNPVLAANGQSDFALTQL